MQNLNLEATEYTPRITLDPQNKIFEFIGESYPENTFEFYEPVISWFKNYLKDKQDIKIVMELSYLNSSSLKSFYDIFELLNQNALTHDSSITIEWVYDEENDIALETGENMDEDFEKLGFTYIAKSE